MMLLVGIVLLLGQTLQAMQKNQKHYRVIKNHSENYSILVSPEGKVIARTIPEKTAADKKYNVTFVELCAKCNGLLDNGDSMLHHAMRKGVKEVLLRILSLTPDPNGDSNLYTLMQRCYKNLEIDYLAPHFTIESLLYIPSVLDLYKHIQHNPWLDGFVNSEGYTPKALALKNKNTADFVDAYQKETGKVLMLLPPLHFACTIESLPAVCLLLHAGADVNSKNHVQETPLHIACRKKNRTLIELLLLHGADVDAVDCQKNSCYDLMAQDELLAPLLTNYEECMNFIIADSQPHMA